MLVIQYWDRATKWPPVRRAWNVGLRWLDGFDALIERPYAWPIAVVLVFALQFALIFTHEPWLDEWQALQIALQSRTFDDLLVNLRYEGHPPLWYLILRGMAEVVDPFWALAVTAAILAAITQGAILFTAPFTRPTRLLIASSCFVLFEFMTISRSLTLGVCLLFLAMPLWRSRWLWLVIALLPQCDFLFGVLSGLFVVLKWSERHLWWPGVVLWLVSGTVAAWTVIPAPGAVPAIPLAGLPFDLGGFVLRLGILLVPFQWDNLTPGWDALPLIPFGPVLGMAFPFFGYYQTRENLWHARVFWVFFTILAVFSVLVYPLPPRHLMLAALLIVLLAWLRAQGGEQPPQSFRIWQLVATICGLVVAALNFVMPFDTAHRAAREIVSRSLQDKLWLSYPDSRSPGVAALTGMTFMSLEKECLQTFVRWDHSTAPLKTPKFAEAIKAQIAKRGQFYMLSDMVFEFPPQWGRTIAVIPAGYDRQKYILYELGSDRLDANPSLPPCVDDLVPFPAPSDPSRRP